MPASQQNNTGKEKANDRERERCASLTTELRNKVIVNNTGKYVKDELQKKESNIDRQTVKKEDNHDHNNLVSYQCIKYFTKFTKILRDRITTPVDCPRVSLVQYKYISRPKIIFSFTWFCLCFSATLGGSH